jgi:methylglutaconyl-CoA hydratase
MARRVFMSARIFGAQEAHELGLVARVSPVGDLDELVEAEVEPYLSVAPAAVGAAKALARRLGPVIDDEVIEDTIARLADVWETEEAAHGIEAFFAKRPPRWQA